MLSLCTQTAFSLLLYHAYSLTDAFFVANGVGGTASGAVGGTAAIGAFTIVSRVQSFASTPFSGVMQGIQPMLGFDFGRRSYARIKRTIMYAFRFALAYGVFAAVMLFFTSEQIIALFDRELLTQGGGALRVLCWALAASDWLIALWAVINYINQRGAIDEKPDKK